ncbi:hypothetical protein F4802DRAFT_376426 [Xylaria palmicola]|nr:hypothetical protein F4802DRAFT_376426 [Xylaria palmicola]
MSFTLTPFLYQTRTILRVPAHRASAAMTGSFHATARHSGDSIPFDFEIRPPGADKPADDAPTGTITPSERRVFERIFADIESRGLKPVIEDDNPPSPDATANSDASRSVMLIMRRAAIDAHQESPTTVAAPSLLTGAAKDPAKALLRFPPQLREAAGRAMKTIQDQLTSEISDGKPSANASRAAGEEDDIAGEAGEEWQASTDSLDRAIELDAKRRPERARIEGLIMSAPSDFELWDVLEKEVFTMPFRLGIMKSKNVPGFGGHDGAEPGSAILEDDATQTLPDEGEKLSMYVHGPLYPAYLLLALRRLDTGFHAPSPLVFSLLPRIKELGLESYILGVSTPFFNELLTIYWRRRGDLSGMLDLLEEMRHCGIYFDNQTSRILQHAEATVFHLTTGLARSGFGRALMMMPEYEKAQRERIRHWHTAVEISLQEKKLDHDYV